MIHSNLSIAGNEVSGVSTSELVINTEPAPDQVQYLEDRIYEFNSGIRATTGTCCCASASANPASS
jgi:hypothetical protein